MSPKMSNNMKLFIPSYNRPDAPLIKKFVGAGVPFYIVLDHKEDVDSYRKYESSTCKIWLIDGGRGIGYVRQRIKSTYNGEAVVMMDDDTTLHIRSKEDRNRVIGCSTPEKVREWYRVLKEFCEKNAFDIGGVADSLWCNKSIEPTIRNGSYCSVTIFNSQRCKEINYDPNLYSRMEDWDLLAQAIQRKFDFLICNDILRHCPMNKEAADIGGCSSVYRNKAEMLRTYNYALRKWGGEVIKPRKSKKIGEVSDFLVNLKRLRKLNGYDY